MIHFKVEALQAEPNTYTGIFPLICMYGYRSGMYVFIQTELTKAENVVFQIWTGPYKPKYYWSNTNQLFLFSGVLLI